ncbi:F11F12.2-like protein [Hibiscus syriacus]|uniref:F11F12.2-like protein n=1 Tax=Hibiscus syriacus TaxID=106335 RepID=A0A6A3C4Z1_HIBSY|nr:F11F12.2-like protein [Hibiscus syriacus]
MAWTAGILSSGVFGWDVAAAERRDSNGGRVSLGYQTLGFPSGAIWTVGSCQIQRLHGDDDKLLVGGNTREVKLTLSKKELLQLVHDMNQQGLTLEQGLAKMVDGGDVYEAEQRRTWKPVVQSIPEVN